MIQVMQEITDWKDQPVANGQYHLNSYGFLVAYQAPGGDLKKFKKPMKQFSKSRRKFELISEYPDSDLPNDVRTVKGSTGNVYTITNGKCSCPGFTFRGKCKHAG